MQQIIYTDEPKEFENCEVVEQYDFGDEIATVVEGNPIDFAMVSESQNGINAIEDPFTGKLQATLEATTNDPTQYVSLGEYQELHNIADADSDRTDTGDGITVVVMDSGIDETHPVFEEVPVQHVDMTGAGAGDAIGHGTAVGAHIARIAPDVELISLRIFGEKGRTGAQSILKAYEWLHQNASQFDMVNMSWGASRRSERLDNLQNKLVQKGVRDVVAAGNTGEEGGSPATANLAFAVGACTSEGDLASFSSYNPSRTNPEVTAIGKDVRLAQAQNTSMGVDLPGRWTMASGTSFAAPAAAGLIARYQSEVVAETGSPHNPSTIKRAFIKGARDIPSTPRDGEGLVDYAATMEMSGTPDPDPEDPDEGSDSDDYLTRVQAYLERTFGAPNVSPDTYYANEGYHPDFVVQGPFCTFVIEVENEVGNGRSGLGQALDYAAIESQDEVTKQVVPVVIVPTSEYTNTDWQNRLAQSRVLIAPFPRAKGN